MRTNYEGGDYDLYFGGLHFVGLCHMFGPNYRFNSLNVNIILYILYKIYFHMSINAMKIIYF